MNKSAKWSAIKSEKKRGIKRSQQQGAVEVKIANNNKNENTNRKNPRMAYRVKHAENGNKSLLKPAQRKETKPEMKMKIQNGKWEWKMGLNRAWISAQRSEQTETESSKTNTKSNITPNKTGGL